MPAERADHSPFTPPAGGGAAAAAYLTLSLSSLPTSVIRLFAHSGLHVCASGRSVCVIFHTFSPMDTVVFKLLPPSSSSWCI